MKKSLLLLLVCMLFCHFSVTAQNTDSENNEDAIPEENQVAGNSLNIYHPGDSINTVGLSSGSASVGKNNVVGLFSGAFGMRNTMGTTTERIFVFGSDNTVSTSGSFVVGRHVTVSGTLPSFVIGEGVGASYPLTPPSGGGLIVGINSTKPTVTVTRSNNSLNTAYQTRTGKVAIGDVTPTAKLHIRSDTDEDAGIILEPKQPFLKNTYIQLRDGYHKISVSGSGAMQVTAGNHNLNLSGNNFEVSENRMDVGTTRDLRLVFTAQDTPGIYSNANPSHGIFTRYSEGPSYALRFGDDGLTVRTAEYQRERTEITNWHDALFVGVDSTITLNGKVGVNTDNTTTDYALAVAGGVLANKVFIQSVDDWPDYVFEPDYERMPLSELERYVTAHGHLPDVPSAEETKGQGYDLGTMQAALLRKVEEMTLYVIELEKRIAELEGRSSGDTVRFTYDACGNRIGRTIEFSRMDGEDGGKGGKDPTKQEEWFAELQDSFLGGDVTLFPNPTDGAFTLALTGDIPSGVKATLLTLTGVVVSQQTINDTPMKFDLNGKPAGVYLLRIETGKETKTWKVIKKN